MGVVGISEELPEMVFPVDPEHERLKTEHPCSEGDDDDDNDYDEGLDP